jgi:hypothetical protein
MKIKFHIKNMQNVVSLFCKNKIDARKKGEDEKNRGTILAEQIPQATIPIQLLECEITAGFPSTRDRKIRSNCFPL